MDTINAKSIKQLRNKIEEALELLDDCGFNFELGNASYSPEDGDIIFKLKAVQEGADGRELGHAKRMAKIEGIPENAFDGFKGMMNGREGNFKITEYSSRKRKNPWVVENLDSKDHWCVNTEWILVYGHREIADLREVA